MLENQVEEFKRLVEELAQQNAYLKFNDEGRSGVL